MQLTCNKSSGQNFTNIIQTACNINSENKIIFTPNKVTLRVVDISKVMLFNIELNKSMFDKYEVREDISLGINFDILHKTIKGFKDGFTLMYVNEKLMIISSDGKTKRVIAEISIEEQDNPMPTFTYPNIYEVNLEHFIYNVEMAIEVDEMCKLEGDEKIILSSSRVMEELETQIEATVNNKEEKQVVNISSAYLLKLKPMKKVIEKIKLHLCNDTPLTISYNDDKINLITLIAPRMGNT